MNFELDHFFVIASPGAPEAEQLVAAGLHEGAGNTHPGQGTANRRFFFTNSMLELLWLNDEAEAISGPGRRMKLADRAKDPEACPFGLVFRPIGGAHIEAPFTGWKYEPGYLCPPKYLHIGANSDNLTEPLLVFVPYAVTHSNDNAARDNGHVVRVNLSIPLSEVSVELSRATAAQGFSLDFGMAHLLEVYGDSQEPRLIDVRPDLPLVIYR